MLRLVVAVAACHLAQSDQSCALDDSCAPDETALLQMKPMRSLEEIGEEADEESEAEGRLHRRRRGKKFGHAISGAVNKGKEIYDKGKELAESDLGKAAIKAAKAHSGKALALLEEFEEEDDEEEVEVGADEESEVEGRLHRRRRGKKFGHAISGAVKTGKDLYDKGKALADSELGQAAIKAAKAHSKKALELLEDVEEEEDDEEVEVADSESEEADEESEAEGRLHRRRRGKKFGHAISGAVNKGKEIYDKGKALADSELGQAAIKAAKAHSKKALALLEEVEEEDDEEEGEADEESEVEGRLHRRRRGKKFGHAIGDAANEVGDAIADGINEVGDVAIPVLTGRSD